MIAGNTRGDGKTESFRRGKNKDITKGKTVTTDYG